MSPFLWVALTITVVYIIYYTVMIMNDLYGEKAEDTNKAEEIDVPTAEGEAPPDEVPIAVVESDSGFHVGEQAYEALPVMEEQDDVEDEQTATPERQDEPPKPSPAEVLQQVQEARCEPIESDWDNPMLAEDFNRRCQRKDGRRIGSPEVKTIEIIDEI